MSKQNDRTSPAIPKTMNPPKIDRLTPDVNHLKSGLPNWKGDLGTAILLNKLNNADSFSEYNINAWWVNFNDRTKSIIVYCKFEELNELGLRLTYKQ